MPTSIPVVSVVPQPTIAAVQTSAPARRAIVLPTLAAGERNAGLILDAEGNVRYLLILLPDELSAAWDQAENMAASIGGTLLDFGAGMHITELEVEHVIGSAA